MNTLSTYFDRIVLAVLITGVLAAPAAAQSGRIDGGMTARKAFTFFWETRLDPPAPPLAQSFGTALVEGGDDVVHRVMVDRAQKTYFGYNVRVEPLPDSTFRVTFQPLTMSPEVQRELQRMLGSEAATWKMLPPPGFPAPRTIRPSDVLELKLLTGSTWGQTLTDYVTIREPEPGGFRRLTVSPPDFSFAPGNSRDFTLEDVELRLDQPSVSVLGRDGAVRDMTGSPFLKSIGDVSGAVVWVYVPNRGRYLLSMTPRSEFVRAGEVRGTSLRFRMDDESINIATRSRMAPGDAAFNLYVRREPAWVPTYANANRDAIIIGTD